MTTRRTSPIGRLTRAAIAAGVLVAITAMAARPQRADVRTLPGGEEADSIIAALELEGLRWPRPASPPSLPRSHRDRHVGGNADRRCVQSVAGIAVRSGEFVIGGEHPLSHRRTSKIWWAPLVNAKAMHLVVRGQLLGSPADTLRFESSSVAHPVSPGQSRDEVEIDDYFFPSGFRVPGAGSWIVVATSGPNWGCFILPAT